MASLQQAFDTLFSVEFFGNSLARYLAALCVGLVVPLVLLTLRRYAQAYLARTEGRHFLMLAVRQLGLATQAFFVLALAVAAARYMLDLPPRLDRVVVVAVTIAVVIQIGMWGTALLTVWIAGYLNRRAASDPASASAGQIIKVLALTTFWSALLLLVLSNFGVDITGLIAGMGIGGIAIAFALQSILRDLFASLAIVLDKPFVVGDFIVFGDMSGTVEQVGLKTTRVRSLSGEQITVANDDLLNTRLRNYKRMAQRRIVFNTVVEYDTPVAVLAELPGAIKALVAGIDNVRFDRCHVASLDDSGIRVETVYNVLSADFGAYMEIQQRINLGILTLLAERGAAPAYPTQRLLTETVERRAPGG